MHRPKPPAPVSSPAHLFSLLKQSKTLESVKQIHSQMLVAALHFHNHLLCKLVDLKNLSYSSLVFSHIPSPNDFSFNIMIRGLSTSWKDYPLALHFYAKLLHSGEKPTKFTYPFIFISAGNLPSPYHGLSAHSSSLQRGLDSDLNTQHSLITMYARCSDLKSARKVFDEITERDVVSWNAMISGCLRTGCPAQALGVFRRMRREGFEMNGMTAASVLAACGEVGDLKLGREVAGLVEESGVEMNSFIWSALIDMHGKCGNLEEARRIFDGILEPKLPVWNAMITGWKVVIQQMRLRIWLLTCKADEIEDPTYNHRKWRGAPPGGGVVRLPELQSRGRSERRQSIEYSQNGLSDEAINLFNTMRRKSDVEPDKMTLVGVLSACGATGAQELGRRLDDFASMKNLHHNVYVATALIDMHAKCGDVDRAVAIFRSMPRRNIVSWNAMISGLAFHGRAREAISLFAGMRAGEGDLRPNEVTFIGILTACVHAGLVEEGRHWFRMMKDEFGVSPKIEHFSCIVDLLARAGKLEEAWELIENMPEKPDGVMLGALLCACRNFRNVDVGERVMGRILELEPSNSGNYVISSKIYAGSNRWDDSARMRGMMRERGVSKMPGCSWIEVEDEVFEFHACEGLIAVPTDQIRKIVELLIDEMKRAGYSPNIHLIYDIFQLLPELGHTASRGARDRPKFMSKPSGIFVKRDELTLEGIEQFYVDTEREEWKLEALCDLYETLAITQNVIFVNTLRNVDWLTDQMRARDYTVSANHGDMDQNTRDIIMREFFSGSSRVLITTELLAHVIDVQQVSLVMNYDLHTQPENYHHRIGQSGCFGREGVAIKPRH
ncbi:Pentatricopeptide repeat-containing protein [Platanthera zijinensis]|uniref:Pentatricopeptide repeat-containing protein n=1 Tax=Platanthera zijinensis TaxID=2320716 RepID=A0AAP0GDX7_9ASPA